jgi:prolyl-tRNA synthetase
MVTGANEADMHLIHVNTPRDFQPTRVLDLVQAREQDPCPSCGAPLVASRGIEVGQIFKLGTKYSAKLAAVYLDETGVERPFVMGCYGIGVTRTVAAAIEQHHDDDGVAWPISIAPFEVLVLPVNMGHGPTREAAEALYTGLRAAGIDVLIDDRDERPGNKFKDADLVGVPLRVTVGEKGLQENVVELRQRETRAVQKIATGEALEKVKSAVERERLRLLDAAPTA